MSFDLFLQKFENGDEGVITTVERKAMLTVLDKCRHDEIDKHGFYNVEFPAGGHVEFSAKGLDTGEKFNSCAFHLRGFSDEVIAFVYDIAIAGNLVIINPQSSDEENDPLFLPTKETQIPHLPDEDDLKHGLCTSAEILEKYLTGGFNDWSDYRDHVMATNTNSVEESTLETLEKPSFLSKIGKLFK